MNAKKGKGPVFDPGLCRCCGTLKKCRVLNVEYESLGQKEVYSDMLMDCYGLLLSHLDGKLTQRLICATCVQRLRDALAFRLQVLRCEEAFLQLKIHEDDQKDPGEPAADSKIQVEVKMEPEDASELHDDRDDDMCYVTQPATAPAYDSADDVPLQVLLTERPKNTAADNGSRQREVETPNYDDDDDTEMDETAGADVTSKKDKSLKRNRTDQKETTSEKIKKMRQKMEQMLRESKEIPMSKLQQRMRERDPSYITETNILTIVEYSHVCPFKCRHNHLLCFYCGENFSDPLLLRDHTATTHHPRKFKITDHKNMLKVDLTRIDCRLCTQTINNLDDFKKHITGVHKKKYYFNTRDMILPFRLTKHEYKCAVCDAAFPYFHALNKHMNEHYSNYVCETCGLGFVDRGRFLMHQQRHESGDFPCEQCGKVFKAQYNRELHVDRVHNKRGRVYCPKCDVRLMTYPQKLKHLVEVHGEAPMSFPCNLCDKVCETRRQLTIHRRKEHLKDYRYECQCCGQKFFTRFALTNHMPTHTGERNYKCKVCEKTYPRLKTLKDHIRIHTNDRRYRCHICGQAFIQNCSLKGHMKTQHPEYS